jgi:hypothetical protein
VTKARFAFQTRSGALSPGMANAVGRIHEAAMEGLEDAAHLVLDASNEDVPVLDGPEDLKWAGASDPGELKRSGNVLMEPEEHRAAIAYPVLYASLQHERLDYHHSGGGKAKFLERALLEKRQEAAEMIATKIREVIGS